MCRISVVTSVYNGEGYIAETIESVIAQTFTDWEYILIDNASEDRSAAIIEEYAKREPRIRFYRNERNIGFFPNLNRGLELATGKYVARTDADDLSRSDRFRKQFDYMEAHPETALVGSRMVKMENGREKAAPRGGVFPGTPEETRFFALYDSPFPHSSFFMRRESMEKHGIRYRGECKHCGDYALLADMLRVGEASLLPEELVIYRLHPGQWTNLYREDLKRGERIEVQKRLLKETAPKELLIPLEKAIRGDMKSKADVREFSDALAGYAIACGVGDDAAKLGGNACFRQVYLAFLIAQRGSPALLEAYMTGPYREQLWFLKRRGLSLIKRCALRKERL